MWEGQRPGASDSSGWRTSCPQPRADQFPHSPIISSRLTSAEVPTTPTTPITRPEASSTPHTRPRSPITAAAQLHTLLHASSRHPSSTTLPLPPPSSYTPCRSLVSSPSSPPCPMPSTMNSFNATARSTSSNERRRWCRRRSAVLANVASESKENVVGEDVLASTPLSTPPTSIQVPSPTAPSPSTATATEWS